MVDYNISGIEGTIVINNYLDLAEAVAPSPQKGVSGKKLLRFAGILNADE
jgi:hypothetical protein